MRKGSVSLGILVVAVATCQGLSGQALAQSFSTPTQTFTIPLTQTDWGPSTSSLAGLNPFQIQKFNASTYNQGGMTAVLTGVELSLDYQFNNTISMRFDNVSTITVNASGTMNLTLPDNVTKLVPTAVFANSAMQTSTPADVFSKFVTLPTATFTGTKPATYTQADSAILSQFTGTGTIGLPVFATAQSQFTTTSGNGFGSSVTLATATIRLLYRYSLVPEPASVALMGIGLTGLLLAGRSRTRGRVLGCR